MMDTIHVWQRHDLVLTAALPHPNPYTEVIVWADLEGPSFSRRVYGFWDGGATFRVRVTATAPGTWTWVSGCSVNGVDSADAGLTGKAGSFEAIDWTCEEKAENACRRGFLRPTSNGHAFQYADGTPCLLLGDTWWATPTYRFPWQDGDTASDAPIKPHPGMSFQDMVRCRKAQGFNAIAMLAGHPAWANDDYPPTVIMNDKNRTVIRNAWQQAGTGSAKNMHNEGGRPFLFPGHVAGYEDLVPDFDRINPAYFQALDRKIDYLNEMGFIPFIEVARRDVSQVWKTYGGWPDSYARYIHYVFTRYQANNTLLSPIHFDWENYSIPSRDYNEPANQVADRFGPPPFGNLVSTNAAPSTLTNFGSDQEARWRTFHQIGNWREHDHYWYLTEIYNYSPARPAINGEPYYPGFPRDCPPTNSEEAEFNNRSGIYGSFLSGGLGGMFYGVEGIWGGDIEECARYRIWDALQFRSGDQVRHLRAFADAAGGRYADLVPDNEKITPNKSGRPLGYIGWAFCATLPDKDLLLAYFERHCPDPTLRGLLPDTTYRVRWFDPRTGEWGVQGGERLAVTNPIGRLPLEIPQADYDWGLCLEQVR